MFHPFKQAALLFTLLVALVTLAKPISAGHCVKIHGNRPAIGPRYQLPRKGAIDRWSGRPAELGGDDFTILFEGAGNIRMVSYSGSFHKYKYVVILEYAPYAEDWLWLDNDSKTCKETPTGDYVQVPEKVFVARVS